VSFFMIAGRWTIVALWRGQIEADLLIVLKRNWIRPTGSLLSVWATRLNKLEINGRDIGTSGFRVSFRNSDE
jgi:hypothetical protein